ncbi:MAG: Uncharacterised protein [Cyanobium sp. ARS6]|nr:MAG: Uncharacterised protein [Cyanobium sp. ARS6]
MPLGGSPDLAVGMEACSLLIEQGMQTLGTAETELQRNGPEVTQHKPGGAMHFFNPIGELPGIGHRCRKSDKLHRRRRMNDRFLPDRAALGVVHVVALIEHNGLHIGQGIVMLIGFCVEHVPEDLRGHHHDRSLPVDTEIAGHQTDVLGTELLAEIAQLLIGESFERCGVKDFLAMSHGSMNGVLADQRLAGSRGCSHHHGMSLVQSVDRLQLKIIQRKGKQLRRIRGAPLSGL